MMGRKACTSGQVWRRGGVAVWALACGVALAGCDPNSNLAGGKVGTDAGTSPQGNIRPKRLATHDARAPGATADAAARGGGMMFSADGGFVLPDAAPPPPKPLTVHEVVPAEQLVRRELVGLVLQARWLWKDVPKPIDVPEVSAEGVEAARLAAKLGWRVEISETGRLRAVADTVALPFPKGAELLARADRYGSFVLWPNGGKYRVVAPGALRAALGERRVDVTPLTPGKRKLLGEGERLELPTRKIQLSSPQGTVVLELATIAEAGQGAPLLCRMMAEIVGIDPSTPDCEPLEVVLRADFSWAEGGGVAFEVESITRHNDLPASDFLVPPPGARYAASGLPTTPAGIFFTREELGTLRTQGTTAPDPPAPGAPGEGFAASNQSDRLLYLLLDGVPVVAVPPWAERYVIGPRHGRYRVQWRTFLGDLVEPPVDVDLPARLVFGAADAGAGAVPDGG